MATFVEVVKFEGEAPPNTIRLVKSGEFYRAYNHSAWLFQQCIAEHKVMRKYVKQLGEDIFYIGFPEKSLIGNIGERHYQKTERGYDITLRDDELPAPEGYETWKATVKTEQSSKGDFHSLPLSGAEAEKEVLRRLRDFPLESKSMVECAVLLAELRRMLSYEN